MDITLRMSDHALTARAAAAAGIVLLKNTAGTLTLLPAEDGAPLPVAVFGIRQLLTPAYDRAMTPWRAIGVLDGLMASDAVRPDGLLARKYRTWAMEHPDGSELPLTNVDFGALRHDCAAAVVVIGRTPEQDHMIGELVGKQDEAASVVESMQKTFDEIKANAGDGSKTVYFEVSPLQYGLWTAGTGTFMDEIANMMGLKNCFADVTGWSEISEEQVLERNPDYIVTISMYYGEGPTPEEEILARPGWENVTAVKNGKILNLQNNELSRPAPRLAEGAQALYDFVYGE